MAKNKNASVDTNVLLRWLLGDVEHQEKRVNELLSSGAKYEIADLALNEVVYVLERFYKIERAVVVQNILAIIRHPQFVCNRNLFEKTRRPHQPRESESSFLHISSSKLLQR